MAWRTFTLPHCDMENKICMQAEVPHEKYMIDQVYQLPAKLE